MKTEEFLDLPDYQEVSLEEERHYYSCLNDVIEAFQTHGIKDILSEIRKKPELNQQLIEYIKSLT
jgi:hypothetical protein